MPLIGFAIFAVMTYLPFILIFVGPAGFFGFLYTVGFVPSAVTALFFQAFVRQTRPLVGVFATCLVSMLTASLWWVTITNDAPTNIVDPSSYAYRALMAASFGAALVMALSGLRARKRRQSQRE